MDWNDDDDNDLRIVAATDNSTFYDYGQVFTDLKQNDDIIEDELLLEWFRRIGHNISPTPFRLLKYAERKITTFEKARVTYEKLKSKGVTNFLKRAAKETALNKNSLDDYLRKFREGAPSIKPHQWKYDHAIQILRRQRANGEKENRAAAAREAGVDAGALMNKLKKYSQEFEIHKKSSSTPHLDLKALELYRAQPVGKKNLTAVAAAVGKALSNFSKKIFKVGERQWHKSTKADKKILEECFQRLIARKFTNLTEFCLVETAATYLQINEYIQKNHPEWQSKKTSRERYKKGDYKSHEEAYQRMIKGNFLSVPEFCKVDKAVHYKAMDKYVRDFYPKWRNEKK